MHIITLSIVIYLLEDNLNQNVAKINSDVNNSCASDFLINALLWSDFVEAHEPFDGMDAY